MKVVIVEDEINAFQYLQSLISKVEEEIEIVAHLESVKSAVNFFQNHTQYDLIFLDIHIADGLSFEIFNHVNIEQPIIFVTAFDQYAIEAFKHHSVDYLLKPIHLDDLKKSMKKYHQIYDQAQSSQSDIILDMVKQMKRRKKNRCLVKKGGHFEYINVQDIAFVESEDSLTFLFTFDENRYVYPKSVEQLYEELDQDYFYQINRSQIVNSQGVKEIHPFLNQRLKLKLSTKSSLTKDFVVSRPKMTSFKDWMDR